MRSQSLEPDSRGLDPGIQTFPQQAVALDRRVKPAMTVRPSSFFTSLLEGEAGWGIATDPPLQLIAVASMM